MRSERKITYESFTERVANRADVSAAEADAYIHQFSETAGEALEDGGEVQLYRFGRFVTEHVDERSGHNPGTGEAITIPGHTRVEFRPYQALLLAVNWPFRHLRTRMLSEGEADTRPGVLFWLVLLLVFLALILIGFAVNSWISSRGSDVAAPAAASVATPASVAAPAPVAAPASVAAPAPVAAPVAPPVVASTSTESPRVEVAPVVAAGPIAAAGTTSGLIVARGDTLWGIAVAHWRDASWWPVIYAENRVDRAHRNPDLIETGRSLRLPVLTGSAARPTTADLRLKTNAYRIVADDYARMNHVRAAEFRFVADRGFTQ